MRLWRAGFSIDNGIHIRIHIYMCDRIRENLPYGIFFSEIEFDAWSISSYNRANPRSSLRPNARFVVDNSALFAIAPHPR